MPELRVYHAMLHRCYDKNYPSYPMWGGRGVRVCVRWRHSFLTFLRDMGRRPPNRPGKRDYTLDRIDNDGDYCPQNCRWATPKQQNNNLRSNKRLTFNGVTLNVTQWAEKLGIPRNTIFNRLRLGWSVEQILTIPKRKYGQTLTHKGLTLTFPQWSKRVGVPALTIADRLRRGWSIKKALTTPPRRWPSQQK